jgi:hypothetical protein
MNMQLDPVTEGFDTRPIKYYGQSYCVPDHGIVAFATGSSLASNRDPLDESECNLFVVFIFINVKTDVNVYFAPIYFLNWTRPNT